MSGLFLIIKDNHYLTNVTVPHFGSERPLRLLLSVLLRYSVLAMVLPLYSRVNHLSQAGLGSYSNRT